MLFKVSAVVLGASAGLQLASAQSLTLSSGCSTTLQNIVTSSNNQCLNAGALLSLATSSSNTSIVPIINTWLTGLCSQPLCSNATIEAVVNSVASGCSTDLSSLGLNPGDLQSLLPTIDAAYPTVRQVVCLKDGSTLCPTQLLTAIEASLGTLSISTIPALLPGLINSGQSPVPTAVICSNCVKQSYNVIQKSYPGLFGSDETSYLSKTCGATFTDGTTPSGITQSAVSGNGTSNTSGAMSKFVGNVVPSLLAVTAVALLVWGVVLDRTKLLWYRYERWQLWLSRIKNIILLQLHSLDGTSL